VSVTADGDKYQQVAAELERRIRAGAYQDGMLPPTATLAGEFGIAIKTVQRALRQLDVAGLTTGRQGAQRRIAQGDGAPATRYEQVAAELIHAIESGRLSAGSRVPPEVELVAAHNVSRATVRIALDSLESSGRIIKRAGRRYVAGRSNQSDLAYERVAAEIGHAIKSDRYSAGRLPGENKLAADFGVSRPTIRQALALLQSNDIVYAAPKQGWFVVSPKGS
jgi:DNA-binding GntR family transcriptional regulator